MRSESLKALLSRGSYAVLAFALVAEASAAETRINVERPKQDEVVSGVTNVYGWALGDPYLDVLEVAVDDGPFKGLPYGGEREDVHQVFPGYPFSDDSGFALTVNTRELGNGPHEITIRADNGVEVAEKTVRFVVSNPPGAPGEDNPAKLRVDLSGATVSVVGTDSLFIEGMLVDGQSVNTVVSFSRASNAFVMSSFQYDSNRDGVFDDDLDEDGFHDDDANGDGLHDHQKVKGTVVSVAAGPVVRVRYTETRFFDPPADGTGVVVVNAAGVAFGSVVPAGLVGKMVEFEGFWNGVQFVADQFGLEDEHGVETETETEHGVEIETETEHGVETQTETEHGVETEVERGTEKRG